MKIKAYIKDMTKTNDPDFTGYSKTALDEGIDPNLVYMVVCDSVLVGTAMINYNFPSLEITIDCHEIAIQGDVSNNIVVQSGIVYNYDENRVITGYELCNFTIRKLKENEVSNITVIDD